MAVTIRPAAAGDRATCLELIQTLNGGPATAAWGITFDTLLARTRGEVHVAEDNEDGILGIATVSYNLAIRLGGEYCQLEELYVDPRARGRNVGGLLIETAIGRARERGCAEMGIHITHRFAGNRPFYEKYGFVHTGEEVRQGLDPRHPGP